MLCERGNGLELRVGARVGVDAAGEATEAATMELDRPRMTVSIGSRNRSRNPQQGQQTRCRGRRRQARRRSER